MRTTATEPQPGSRWHTHAAAGFASIETRGAALLSTGDLTAAGILDFVGIEASTSPRMIAFRRARRADFRAVRVRDRSILSARISCTTALRYIGVAEGLPAFRQPVRVATGLIVVDFDVAIESKNDPPRRSTSPIACPQIPSDEVRAMCIAANPDAMPANVWRSAWRMRRVALVATPESMRPIVRAAQALDRQRRHNPQPKAQP